MFAQFRPAALAELFPGIEELDLTHVARQVKFAWNVAELF